MLLLFTMAMLLAVFYYFLEYMWQSLETYQRFSSMDSINGIVNKSRSNMDHILKTKSYFDIYLIGIETFKTGCRIYLEWCLAWTKTYNIVSRMLVYISFIYVGVFFMIALCIYSLLKILCYYILVAGILLWHRFSQK